MAAGVAAQQAQAVLGGGLGGHVLVPVGADAGGAAVDATGGCDLPGGVPGLLDALHRLGAGNGARGPVGEPHDVADTRAAPVEHHETGCETGRHCTRRVRIP